MKNPAIPRLAVCALVAAAGLLPAFADGVLFRYAEVSK